MLMQYRVECGYDVLIVNVSEIVLIDQSGVSNVNLSGI